MMFLCETINKQLDKQLLQLKNNSMKLEKLRNHNTRASSQYNFHIPNIRTDSGKSLSAFAGAQIWREVPQSIKSLSTVKFKKLYVNYLLEQYKPIN